MVLVVHAHGFIEISTIKRYALTFNMTFVLFCVSLTQNQENVLAECRMRFLSFMGIAMRNIK